MFIRRWWQAFVVVALMSSANAQQHKTAADAFITLGTTG